MEYKLIADTVLAPSIVLGAVIVNSDGWLRKISTGLLIALILIAMWFFRCPPTMSFNAPPGVLYAASYGTVLQIDKVPFDPAVDRSIAQNGSYWRIVTFLSPLDIHWQYSPARSVITDIKYHSGTFAPAMDVEKSDKNERVEVTMRLLETKDDIKVILIAGTLARTIEVFKNGTLQTAERFGIIKLGSRVDIIIPEKYKILVKPGDKLVGGLTKVASI